MISGFPSKVPLTRAMEDSAVAYSVLLSTGGSRSTNTPIKKTDRPHLRLAVACWTANEKPSRGISIDLAHISMPSDHPM